MIGSNFFIMYYHSPSLAPWRYYEAWSHILYPSARPGSSLQHRTLCIDRVMKGAFSLWVPPNTSIVPTLSAICTRWLYAQAWLVPWFFTPYGIFDTNPLPSVFPHLLQDTVLNESPVILRRKILSRILSLDVWNIILTWMACSSR